MRVFGDLFVHQMSFVFCLFVFCFVWGPFCSPEVFRFLFVVVVVPLKDIIIIAAAVEVDL